MVCYGWFIGLIWCLFWCFGCLVVFGIVFGCYYDWVSFVCRSGVWLWCLLVGLLGFGWFGFGWFGVVIVGWLLVWVVVVLYLRDLRCFVC